jgi:CheY-like chemotaxis protein
MPEQDGYALIRQVRNLESLRGRGNVPVVALTAYASEQDRAKVRQAGFATHLSKPIEIPELVAVVAELAGRANNHGL